jgi:hypothetical protein
MHTLLAVGVTILTATTPAQPQATLAASQSLNVTFVMPAFEDAMSSLAKMSGVTIELDATVPQDVRRAPLANSAINLRDVKLEEAIDALTRLKGLAYTVVDETTIRIFKQA